MYKPAASVYVRSTIRPLIGPRRWRNTCPASRASLFRLDAVPVVPGVVPALEDRHALFDHPASARQPHFIGVRRVLRRRAVADAMVEWIGGRDDCRALDQLREILDAGKIRGSPGREPGIALEHPRRLRFGQPAPFQLRAPEVTPAHERMVARPLGSALDAGALDAPQRLGARVAAIRHTPARHLHLVGERVQHADHDDPIGAAVETGAHRRGDLVAAVLDPDVGKDEHAPGRERSREVPLLGTLETGQRARLAKLGVLALVERVDVLLELVAIEILHGGRIHQRKLERDGIRGRDRARSRWVRRARPRLWYASAPMDIPTPLCSPARTLP